MALIIKKEMETGLILSDAYCKVEEVNVKKERMNFYVVIYLNKESRIENKIPLETKLYYCEHSVDINENSIKQSYNYLKTLEEYMESIDDYDEQ